MNPIRNLCSIYRCRVVSHYCIGSGAAAPGSQWIQNPLSLWRRPTFWKVEFAVFALPQKHIVLEVGAPVWIRFELD